MSMQRWQKNIVRTVKLPSSEENAAGTNPNMCTPIYTHTNNHTHPTKPTWMWGYGAKNITRFLPRSLILHTLAPVSIPLHAEASQSHVKLEGLGFRSKPKCAKSDTRMLSHCASGCKPACANANTHGQAKRKKKACLQSVSSSQMYPKLGQCM